MKDVVGIINIILPILYLSTFLIYLIDFVKVENKLSNIKRLFLFFTLVFHIFYLIIRTLAFEHPPITNVFEIFTILAFAVSFSYFILELVTDIRGTGLFIIIISFLFQIISSLFIEDLSQVKEVLRSNLLGVHVLNALLGYAGITIAAVYGFLYLLLYNELKLNKFGLIFERLPNLEILERMSFTSAIIGFIFLTLAIVIGIIWLPLAFPTFSYLDPKLIGTGFVWLLYLIVITSKAFGKLRGRKVVVISIVGFIVAIFSTILTNFLADSFHSFY